METDAANKNTVSLQNLSRIMYWNDIVSKIQGIPGLDNSKYCTG